MKKIILNGLWKLGFCDESQLSRVKREIVSLKDVQEQGFTVIDAGVPGNFELDMVREGLLPDLFFGKNLLKSQEYEMTHLFYSGKFNLDIETCRKNLKVIFKGIDTISEVYLNGSLLGKTDNMFLEYAFPMNDVREGENELFVHILPVSLKAREYEGEMYLHALPYNYDNLHIRKSAYMWGWDIFPRILTAGIWKDVAIEEDMPVKIQQAYLFTESLEKDYTRASMKLFYDIELQNDPYKDFEIEITGRCGSSSFEKRERIWSRSGCLNFVLEEPLLWWPAGKGAQNLYEVEVSLFHKGSLADKRAFRAGVRTVELKRTSVTDDQGSGEFCFIVNHKRVFVKGTNWVPLSSFPSLGKSRIAASLELVKEIGCNMVRCWGGGYYEDDDFYEICDREGIMIWQDFMMACGRYPQEEEFLRKFYDEAVYQIKRLRQHPNLCLWSGDNECDEFAKAGRFANLDPNDNKITRKVLKEALRRHDYVRPYLPSSPYIDETAYKGDISYITEDHLWGPRDYFKSDFYTKNHAHFASETGYHGCPDVSSVRRFISEDALWPYKENEEWLLHASSPESAACSPYAYRIPLMARQIEVLFGEVPDNLEAFSFCSQISQAEAVKFFVERFRMGKWRRTGIIWWNMIDGCPQFSDAVVDYYYVKKLAYYYIKQSQQPVCLMFSEPEQNAISLMGVNDTDEDAALQYRVEDILTGELLLAGETVLPADSSEKIAQLQLERLDPENGGFLKIEWSRDGHREWNHYVTWSVPYRLEQYVSGAEKCGLFQLKEGCS